MSGPIEGQPVVRLTGGGNRRAAGPAAEDQVSPETPVEESTPAGEGQDTGEGQQGQENDTQAQSRREADLRQRVKTAEERSSADRELIAQLHRREAVRLAGAHLANGEDLFDVAKVSLEDLLTSDGGDVDETLIKEKAEALIADRGDHFGKRPGNTQHGAGGNALTGPASRKPKTLGEQVRSQIVYGYDPKKAQKNTTPTEAAREAKGTVRAARKR